MLRIRKAWRLGRTVATALPQLYSLRAVVTVSWRWQTGGRGLPPLTNWVLPKPRVNKEDGYVGFLQYPMSAAAAAAAEPSSTNESVAALPAPSSLLGDRQYRECAVVGHSSVLSHKGCEPSWPSPSKPIATRCALCSA
jgi:hypothetical protein